MLGDANGRENRLERHDHFRLHPPLIYLPARIIRGQFELVDPCTGEAFGWVFRDPTKLIARMPCPYTSLDG